MTIAATTLSSRDATTLVECIRSSFESAWDHYADGCRQLVEAYQGKAWEALGLKDWAEFVSHTLDVDHLRIPKAERLEFVRVLTAGGLSVRDVSAAIGMGKSTVQRDVEYLSQMGQPEVVIDAFGSLDAAQDFCIGVGAGPCAAKAGVAAGITEGDTSRENIECRIKEAVEAEKRMVDSWQLVASVDDELPAPEDGSPSEPEQCGSALLEVVSVMAWQVAKELPWGALTDEVFDGVVKAFRVGFDECVTAISHQREGKPLPDFKLLNPAVYREEP